MAKKYLLCDMSYWQSTYTREKVKLLKDNGMKAVVLRAGYGNTKDTLLQNLVTYCRELDIPFGFYWYLYPGLPFQPQIDLYVNIIKSYPDVKCAALDFEEYKVYLSTQRLGVDGDSARLGSAYEKALDEEHSGNLRVNLTANHSPEVLNTFYKNSYDGLKIALPELKVMAYSAKWCIDSYFPKVATWLKAEEYWNAVYVKYYKWYQDFMTSLGGSWGDSSKLISISNLPAIMAEVDKHWNEMQLPTGINDCIIWQFNSFFPFKELTAGQRNIDMNLAPASTFKEYFDLYLEEEIPVPEPKPEEKNIEMEFVSQLGEGADDFNNDCGIADCSAIILEAKDIFVSPNEIYKLDGWDAPDTDKGTFAYQLKAVLNLFDVNSSISYSLDISRIKELINMGYPIIALVKYGLFSNAGLTVNKGTFNHWLIVTGYTETGIITMDSYRPYEAGGTMIVPNKMFTDSYLGTHLVCLIGENETEDGMYNATVNNLPGLNIRESLPDATGKMGKDIGDLVHLQRIRLKEPIIDYLGKDGLIWVALELPQVGFVAKKYLKVDAVVTPPPSLEEGAIRKDELLKAKAVFDAYFTKRNAEI